MIAQPMTSPPDALRGTSGRCAKLPFERAVAIAGWRLPVAGCAWQGLLEIMSVRLGIVLVVACVCGLSAARADADLPVAAPETSVVEDTIRRAYRDTLHREADAEGLATYSRVMLAEGRNERWLRHVLRQSPEGRGISADRRESRRSLLLLSVTWTVMFVLLAAMGRVAARGAAFIAGHPWSAPTVFQLFWLGFGVLIAALQIWSLVFPVGIGCFLFFNTVGCGALWAWVRPLSARHAGMGGKADAGTRGGFIRWRWVIFSVAGGMVVWSAMQGTATPRFTAYDTELYHWNAIRWMNTFPAVPGLANLHIRLGTNSAWLLFAALMDNGVLDQRSAWLLPGFPVAVVALQLLYTVCLDRPSSLRTRLFALCMLPYALKHAVHVLPGLYFDAPALLLQVVFFLEVLRWWDRCHMDANGCRSSTPLAMIMVAMPAVVSFAIKPVGALSLAVAGAVLLVVFIRDVPVSRPWFRRSLVMGGLPGLLLLGWMARNAILSGWLLFPAPYGHLPVDWAVPSDPGRHAEQIQSVRGQQDIIRAWARCPGAGHARVMHASVRVWVPEWIARNRLHMEIRLLLPAGLFLSLVLLVHGWCRKMKMRFLDAGLLSLSAGLLGFWFWMAPSMRFGDGLFWIWFAVAASGAFSIPWPNAGRGWGIAACALLFAWLSYPSVVPMLQGVRYMGSRRIGYAYGWPTRPVLLDNGQCPALRINVPTRGDRAGDADLPSTPYPDDRLLVRRPGSLRHGFKITP